MKQIMFSSITSSKHVHYRNLVSRQPIRLKPGEKCLLLINNLFAYSVLPINSVKIKIICKPILLLCKNNTSNLILIMPNKIYPKLFKRYLQIC